RGLRARRAGWVGTRSRAHWASSCSQLPPELVPGEASYADVLADRSDGVGDDVPNRLLGVAVRLVQEGDLAVPLLELAFDDLVANGLGLLLDALVGKQLCPLGRQDVRRDRVGV